MKIDYPKVFVINLSADVTKKQHMQTLCDKHKLLVEFIQAVDGKSLSSSEIDRVCDKNRAIKNIGREMTLGEIGCVLSHRLIYQKMVDENIKTALILEDDVDFSQQLLNFLPKLGSMTKDWELLLLGYSGLPLSDKFNHNIWYQQKIDKTIIRRPAQVLYGTHGYCLTDNGAKKLLKHTYKIAKPIDHYTGSDKVSNLYAVQNPIILPHQTLSLQSNIGDDRVKTEQQSFKNRGFVWLYLQKLYKKLALIKHIIVTIPAVIKPIRQYTGTNLN